jgi:hypothetical protein
LEECQFEVVHSHQVQHGAALTRVRLARQPEGQGIKYIVIWKNGKAVLLGLLSCSAGHQGEQAKGH